MIKFVQILLVVFILLLNNKLQLYKYFDEDIKRYGRSLIDVEFNRDAYPMDLI